MPSHKVAVFFGVVGQTNGRLDHNIGTHECLAVVLGCFAWFEEMVRVVITIYVGNEAARCRLIKGTSKLPGVAVMAAGFWSLAVT